MQVILARQKSQHKNPCDAQYYEWRTKILHTCALKLDHDGNHKSDKVDIFGW